MAQNSTTALELDNPFWQFALQTYALPKVEDYCLQLQQRGLSVNRVLYCIWLGKTGKQLSDQLEQADHWQLQISHPLRALRYQVRALKQQHGELSACYQAMRKAELAAEQIEIAWLYQASQTAPLATANDALCCNNLTQYLNQHEHSDISTALAELLSAIGISNCLRL